MTTKPPGAFAPARDAEAAWAATTEHFQDAVKDARGALDRAAADLQAAEQRLAEITAGGRITDQEALLVFGALQNDATLAGRDAIAGRLTRDDFDQAVALAETVRRGLVADGHPIPGQAQHQGGGR